MPILNLILAAAILLQIGSPELRIGSIVPREDIAEFSVSDLILHNGDLKPSIEKKINGIIYRIAYEAKNRKIVQISTFDRGFKSSDGLQVGSFVKAKRQEITATDNAVLGPTTADGWHTVLAHEYEIIILKDGIESSVSLVDESWSAQAAKKGIKKLFAKSEAIMVKVEQFSKIKE